MARLPTPGGDTDNWGSVLNGFLSVAHNPDGTLKTAGIVAAGAETKVYKGITNGYASLDENALVPDSQLAVPLSKVGDYIGLYGSPSVDTGSQSIVPWDGTTASRGDSLTWSSEDPESVIITDAGVYAMNITVDWEDSSDTSGSSRGVQLFAECGFSGESHVPSVTDGYHTVQSLEFTAYLQPGDNVAVYIRQNSADTVVANVLMLVTRLS